MGNKMTCPACDSHTSRVLDAYTSGNPCPECALSAAAAREILTVRRIRADEQLKDQCELAIKERDAAQRERDWAVARLQATERDLSSLVKRLQSPLQDERSPWEDA